MTYHGLLAVIRDCPGSAVFKHAFSELHPGAHAAILVDGPNPALPSVGMRRAGFEFRDTILIPAETLSVCLLFRKPIAEKTVAAQVSATGTGGINVDACRVKHSSKADFEAHKAMVDTLKAKGGSLGNSWKNTSDLSNANEVSTAGRWPANLLLMHTPGCKRAGEVRVDAPTINRFNDGMKPFGNGAGHDFTSTRTGDAEGKETLAVYACTPKCMVARLDEKSGHLHKAGNTRPSSVGWIGYHGGAEGQKVNPNYHNDTGGTASRFFSQFETRVELLIWLRTLVLPEGGQLLDLSQELGSDEVSAHVSAV